MGGIRVACDAVLSPLLQRGPVLAVVCSILLVAPATDAEWQDTVVVGSEPSCPPCRIVVERAATLGDRDGPGVVPSYPSGFVRDGRGNFWLTFLRPGELPVVFDSTGRFVTHIGRRGAGPGEFNGFTVARGSRAGDTIYIFDVGNRRVSAYLRPSDEPVRSVQIQGVFNSAFAMLRDGSLVVNHASNLPLYAGAPFHVMGPDGIYRRSFGGDGAVRPASDRARLTRRLTTAAEGDRFWSVNREYVLELWDVNGMRHRVLRRNPAWWRPASPGPPNPDRPPPSVVWSINQDDRGLLWIVTIVGDPQWARGLGPGRPELRVVWRIANNNQYHDTMLEVIDPVAGRLVASVRLPQYVHLLGADGYLVGLADDFEDDPRIHVWRAWLEGAVSR